MGEAKALGVYDIPPAKGVSITLFPQDPVFSCLTKDVFKQGFMYDPEGKGDSVLQRFP